MFSCLTQRHFSCVMHRDTVWATYLSRHLNDASHTMVLVLVALSASYTKPRGGTEVAAENKGAEPEAFFFVIITSWTVSFIPHLWLQFQIPFLKIPFLERTGYNGYHVETDSRQSTYDNIGWFIFFTYWSHLFSSAVEKAEITICTFFPLCYLKCYTVYRCSRWCPYIRTWHIRTTSGIVMKRDGPYFRFKRKWSTRCYWNLFTLHVVTMHNDLVNLMGKHSRLAFCSESKVSHRERSTHYANTVLIDGLCSVH